MSKQQNMAMVLQALKNAGLSDNQARILAAEIGRENSFQDKYLWGYHSDPANKSRNIGIISWQGSRAKGVEAALKEAGLLKGGKIAKGQASLDVMAKYLVNEIQTDPKYRKTKEQFLDNPDVDYHTGTKVLGKNFIRWRYDDPRYAAGHKHRDSFYRQLGGIAPSAGTSTTGEYIGAPASGETSAPKAYADTSAVAHTGGEAYADTTSPTYPRAPRSAQEVYDYITDLFAGLDGEQTTLLNTAAGVAAPSTPTENDLFSDIANLGLDSTLESVWAESARAIAAAKDKLTGRPMLQSGNPLRAGLGSLFDSMEI